MIARRYADNIVPSDITRHNRIGSNTENNPRKSPPRARRLTPGKIIIQTLLKFRQIHIHISTIVTVRVCMTIGIIFNGKCHGVILVTVIIKIKAYSRLLH